jgi:hypothetical protein
MSVKDLLGALVLAGSTVFRPVAHNNLVNQALAELQNYRTPDDRLPVRRDPWRGHAGRCR